MLRYTLNVQLPQFAPNATPSEITEDIKKDAAIRSKTSYNWAWSQLPKRVKDNQQAAALTVLSTLQQNTHSYPRIADSVSSLHCPSAEERLPALHAQRRQSALHEPAPQGAPAAPQALQLAAGYAPPSCGCTPTQSAARAPAPGRCRIAGKQRLSLELPYGNILDSCPPAAEERSEGKA